VSNDHKQSLLADHDPPSSRIINPDGASSFLLIGDHAGRRIPARLGSLGLGPADLARHIAWDIGVASMGRRLARSLAAAYIEQSYSRLVVDCNRHPDAPDAVVEVSDGTEVPGNAGLTPVERGKRIAEIHAPYHSAIERMIVRRARSERPTILVALHSFTPRMGGSDRPWQIGVLHHRGNAKFALCVLARLRALEGLTVGDNEPYAMDSIDYTIPLHAYPAALPYVELEVRQDLVATPEGVEQWSDLLATALGQAELDLFARTSGEGSKGRL
jgi:predicted N-formylglutamate amidohydrolase